MLISMGSVCLQRLNGKRQLVVDWWTNGIPGVTPSAMTTPTIMGTAARTNGRELPRWAVFRPTGTVYMTWPVTWGSGARTGMTKTTTRHLPELTRLGPVRVITAYCAAGAGCVIKTACALRTAASALLPARAVATGDFAVSPKTETDSLSKF